MTHRQHLSVLVLVTTIFTALLLISPALGYAPPGGGGGSSSGGGGGGGDSSGSGETTYSGFDVTGTFTLWGDHWAVSSCSKNCPTPITLTGFKTIPVKINYDVRSVDPYPTSPHPKSVMDGSEDVDKIMATHAASSKEVTDKMKATLAAKASRDAELQENLLDDLMDMATNMAESKSGSDSKKSALAYVNQLSGKSDPKVSMLAQSLKGDVAAVSSMGQGLDSAMGFLQETDRALSATSGKNTPGTAISKPVGTRVTPVTPAKPLVTPVTPVTIATPMTRVPVTLVTPATLVPLNLDHGEAL